MVQKQWCDDAKAVMGTVAGTLAWIETVAPTVRVDVAFFNHCTLSLKKSQIHLTVSLTKLWKYFLYYILIFEYLYFNTILAQW